MSKESSGSDAKWPWWVKAGFALCAVFVLLLLTAVGIRMAGQRELERTIAEIRARSLPVYHEDLLTRAPSVDEHRQQRAWDLLGARRSWVWQGTPAVYGLQRRYHASLAAEAAQGERQSLAATIAERAAWRALWQEGPITLSGYGWVGVDLGRGGKMSIDQVAQVRIPGLFNCRILAKALAAEARLSAHPVPALRDLDAMVEAMHPAMSVIDVMITVAISEIRDEAWLEASCRGIDIQAWLQRMPDLPAEMSEAFVAERCMWWGSMSRSLDPSADAAMNDTGWFESALAACWIPSDIAFGMRILDDASQAIVSAKAISSDLDGQLRRDRWRHPVSSIALPNLLESAAVSVEATARARRTRAAAAIARLVGTVGLPSDAAGFPADIQSLLAGTTVVPPIRYTRMTASRFRLDYDPAGPMPPLVDPHRVIAFAPGKLPFTSGPWGLEWDVAAPMLPVEPLP